MESVRWSILVVVLLTACSPGPPSAADLQRDPASQLRIGGAVELLHFGGDNQMTLDGPVDAWDGYIFGVQIPSRDVLAYYARELARLGWREDPLRTSRLTTETDAKAWCSSNANFSVGIKDQARAFQPDFYQGRSFQTVYEARITARPTGAPCPARLGTSWSAHGGGS